jgi:methionyl-tRNA formyltransferase
LIQATRSGYEFVDYLGFSNFWHYPTVHISDLINNLRGKPKKVYLLSQLASKYNVPIIYTLEPNADAIVDRIASMEPDLIVSTCFDHVIRTRFIRVPKFGIIIVHTSLLPNFRGPFPGLWQALRGCTEVGVSVPYINNEELDVGPIIAQKKTVRLPHESVLSLDCRLYRLGIECAVEAIQEIEQGTVRTIDQNPLEGAGTRNKHSATLRTLSPWRQFFHYVRAESPLNIPRLVAKSGRVAGRGVGKGLALKDSVTDPYCGPPSEARQIGLAA